jgi:hypothetical protein
LLTLAFGAAWMIGCSDSESRAPFALETTSAANGAGGGHGGSGGGHAVTSVTSVTSVGHGGATSSESSVGHGGAGEGGAGGHGSGGAGGGSDSACSVNGNPGTCMDVAACMALADHTSTPGYCPGPNNVECCTLTPNVADDPPIPAGYKLMKQSDVTPEMTTWAVDILHDPTDYPMFSTAMMTFGSLMVLARVEWHPPDFQNGVVHRGVTLYEPI